MRTKIYAALYVASARLRRRIGLLDREHRHVLLVLDEDAVARDYRMRVDRRVGDLDPGQLCVLLAIGLVGDQFRAAGQSKQTRAGVNNGSETPATVLGSVGPGRLAGLSIDAEQIAAVGEAE